VTASAGAAATGTAEPWTIALAARDASCRVTAYVGWLRTVGLQGVERIELSPYPPVTLVKARKGGA
jgi:hypothetical protein